MIVSLDMWLAYLDKLDPCRPLVIDGTATTGEGEIGMGKYLKLAYPNKDLVAKEGEYPTGADSGQEPDVHPGLAGWLCPRCGKSWSPFVQACCCLPATGYWSSNAEPPPGCEMY